MHYKTITLELIRESPALYEQLRWSKMLLPSMEEHLASRRPQNVAH